MLIAIFAAAGPAVHPLPAQSILRALREPGYLTPEQTREVEQVVPPAPATGDPRYQADMSIFQETRSLKGSARWKLAQSDNDLSIAGRLHALRCALGMDLTPGNAPKLAHLLARADSDAGAASSAIKVLYRHKRPFQVDGGEVCLSPVGKAELEHSPDYPSGHATLGWDTGSILAELLPDRADEILARARAFGQSRVVCGVHDLSAVQAGWMIASAVFAMQQASPVFRADLEAAKRELETLRAASKTKPQGCEAEAETLAKSPY